MRMKRNVIRMNTARKHWFYQMDLVWFYLWGVMTLINQYIALLDCLGEEMTDNEKRFIKGIFSGDSSGHDYYYTI